jgi:predicted RNA-binding Zn-ribbon protein involved in translation (DUF1610 family)
MGKKQRKKLKYKYPRKAFVPIYWVIIGISFILVFTMPLSNNLYYHLSYTEAMLIGLLIWTPFMVGAILYSNYFEKQGVRICVNCGKHAYKGRKYCEKCGARVFWRCPKCNIRTSRYLDFCKECGQNLKVVTFARQVEFDGEVQQGDEEKLNPKMSGVVVTGSIIQFCPACGAEISEDLTHCSICGSKFDR